MNSLPIVKLSAKFMLAVLPVVTDGFMTVYNQNGNVSAQFRFGINIKNNPGYYFDYNDNSVVKDLIHDYNRIFFMCWEGTKGAVLL